MSSWHNVLTVTFEEESKAYQAMGALRQADAEGRLEVDGAVIVARQADGTIRTYEGEDTTIGSGIAGGSLIGMLVGVLGGPLGVLLGLGAGAAVGAVVDVDRADQADDVLSLMSATIPAGKTAIVAEVREYAVEVLDGEMTTLGGTITRRPAGELLAEMEAAEEAAAASAKEARRLMREAKKAERAAKREESKEMWDERLAALKSKLSHAGQA
jgi:uncharacterized membrane protein